MRNEWKIKGVSIGVVKQDKEDAVAQWQTDYVGSGVGDEKENPVDERTLFSIGENSNLFTAIATGLVIQEESRMPYIYGTTFDWSTEIKDIAPDWELLDSLATDQADFLGIVHK